MNRWIISIRSLCGSYRPIHEKSGRRGFRAPWREPKALTIYEIDEKGRKCEKAELIYDATVKDADGPFELLVAHLRVLGAHEGAEWTVIGDGAHWTWDRIFRVAEALGYEPDRLTEVVDFYHAVQDLGAIAALVRGWSEGQRHRRVRRMKRLLKDGKMDKWLAEADELCRGRNARAHP